MRQSHLPRNENPVKQTRKTIKITDLVDAANHMLAESVDDVDRVGVFILLERLLLDADAYKGFQFIDGNSGDTDDTRRRYYGGTK